MEICNIKELPSVYKDQIGDRLSSYKLIGVFDMIGRRPLKIYVHFTDFRIKQLKNIVDNPVAGQTPIYYSLQLENEKKPHHYDVDGHWYAQSDKENPYDVVSKVDDKSVLGDVLKDLQKA